MLNLTRLAILALWASFGVHSKVEEVQLFNHNMTSGQRTLAQVAEGGDFGDVRWLLCLPWAPFVNSQLRFTHWPHSLATLNHWLF